MAYVTPLYGGSDAQIDYRLGLIQHGCVGDVQFDYRADARERPLRWIGEGLSAFDVDGHRIRAGDELTPDQYDAARALMQGKHPVTGEQLVIPKQGVPAAAKVSLGPLVAAVRAAADHAGVAPTELFDGDAAAVKAWGVAERAVTRRGGRALARVDEAMQLSAAAGVDPVDVWGEQTLTDASRELFTLQVVRDKHGELVRDRDGRPTFRTVERRESIGIVGFDIGIGVPKSMSLLLAFAPDALVDRVEAVYADAVSRTFSWTEARTSYVMRGKHGAGKVARQEHSSGMSGWVMTHRAARPVGNNPIGDPHWHVHITVANLAQAQDGKWLTIARGGRELMRHTRAIDHATQAQIRQKLHREFGVTFARSERTGQWEVEHIPDEAITFFSKRHNQVTKVLEELGHSNATVSAARARHLTRDSRSGKTEATAAADTTLRAYWREQAVDAGHDPEAWMPAVLAGYQAGRREVGAVANTAMLARHGITLDDLVARLFDPEHGLTAHTRRFSHLDAVAATAEALPHGASLDEVEQLTDVVLSHPMFVALPAGSGELRGGPGASTQLAGSHDMAGGHLYTTGDVPAAEQAILTAVAASHPDQGRAVVSPATVAMAVSVTEAAQGFALSDEQRQVLTAVVTSGRAIEAVEGPPGTGKTTLMRAARVAWQAEGHVVAGAATAAVAAQNLAAESGIESRTVAQWLWHIEHRTGFTGVDVLVVDEANLTSDRDRARLYAEAARTGTKLVEVGDPKQLRGVGVGSIFGYVHAALDGPRLTENRRQRAEDERAALAAYRDGRYVEALTDWAGRGAVVATETSEAAVAAMVASWLRLREGAPDPHTQAQGLLMLAATNEQVARINDAVQAVRVTQGELGTAAAFALPGGREVTFHVGDQILVRRNDRRAQLVDGDPVLNGYRGVVVAVDERGVEVAWRQPGDTQETDPRTTVCSPAYIAAGGLELGYALTSHKAEGLTVGAAWDRPDGGRSDGTVLVYGPGMDNPGLYVSASRHRGSVIVFGALEDVEGDRERLVYGTPRDQAELTDRVIAALAEHAAATAESADDRPVLVDLGHLPADPTQLPTAPRADVSQTPASAAADAAEQHEPAILTDEHRDQWQDLAHRYVSAMADRDQPAMDAVAAERQAFSEQLGADRVAELRREAEEALAWLRDRASSADQAAGGEQLQAEQWRAREHSTLTDAQLDKEITKAARDRAAHLQAVEQNRRRVADLEPAVAAGAGPAVTAVDERLADLRRVLDATGQAVDVDRQLQQARTTASVSTAQAAGLERQAERAPWYRPGVRDRLNAEAAELREQAAWAQTHVDALTRRAAELAERTGQHYSVSTHWPERELERAEATYPRDRERAQRADETELRVLRHDITGDTASAGELGDRRDTLAAEKQLRATMPTDQRTTEEGLRAQWNEQRRAERQAEQARQAERARKLGERSYNPGPDHGLSRGSGLGL